MPRIIKLRINLKGKPIFEVDFDDRRNLFELKDLVARKTGIPYDEMKLEFNGEDLEPVSFKFLQPRPLFDFGIVNNSLIHVRGGVKIFCKMPGARIHQTIVTLFTRDTVADLKKAIRDLEPDNSPPLEDMLLTQDEDILEDEKKLVDYNIGSNWWFTCVTVRRKSETETTQNVGYI